MGKLIYTAIASLDGYVADEEGAFDWAAPDDDVHAFVNDLERPIGAYLYGRRMYEVMVAWETMHQQKNQPSVVRAYAALWQGADKVVYSTTLPAVASAKTRIERVFNPTAIRDMKARGEKDMSIGGPTLAARAFEAALIDECRLFLTPITVGGGTPALPMRLRVALELAHEQRFGNGVVYLQYRVRT